MKIGLLLPTREAILAGRYDTAPMLELAERAEAAGFDSVWAGDSLLARPRFEPLTLLAAVAARARRVEVGTAVLVSPLRNPVLLAHSVATVDQIAQGRLILGLGYGTRNPAAEHEFAAADAPYERRAGRMREQMQICRELWSGEEVNFSGDFWTLQHARLLPKPHRPGGPPLWIGGGGPISLRLTARYADGYLPNSGTAEQMQANWAVVQEQAPAGRQITLAYYGTVNVGPDPAAAQAELDRFIAAYYGARADAIQKRQGCKAGSAEACADWLDGFLSQGVEHLVLRMASDDQATQFDRVVNELLPRLRERYG